MVQYTLPATPGGGYPHHHPQTPPLPLATSYYPHHSFYHALQQSRIIHLPRLPRNLSLLFSNLPTPSHLVQFESSHVLETLVCLLFPLSLLMDLLFLCLLIKSSKGTFELLSFVRGMYSKLGTLLIWLKVGYTLSPLRKSLETLRSKD